MSHKHTNSSSSVAPPGYEEEQSGNFNVPDGYIRFPRRTAGEDDVAACQYSLEVWAMVAVLLAMATED